MGVFDLFEKWLIDEYGRGLIVSDDGSTAFVSRNSASRFTVGFDPVGEPFIGMQDYDIKTIGEIPWTGIEVNRDDLTLVLVWEGRTLNLVIPAVGEKVLAPARFRRGRMAIRKIMVTDDGKLAGVGRTPRQTIDVLANRGL